MTLQELHKQNKLDGLLQRGIEIGLIIFAIGSPFSISLSQIGFINALIFWIVRIIFVHPERLKGSFLDLFLCLYLVGLLLSSIMSIDFFFSLKANRNVWLFSLLYLVLNNADYKFTVRLAKILLVSATLSGIYGIFQSFGGFDLWHWRKLGIYG